MQVGITKYDEPDLGGRQRFVSTLMNTVIAHIVLHFTSYCTLHVGRKGSKIRPKYSVIKNFYVNLEGKKNIFIVCHFAIQAAVWLFE